MASLEEVKEEATDINAFFGILHEKQILSLFRISTFSLHVCIYWMEFQSAEFNFLNPAKCVRKDYGQTWFLLKLFGTP